MTRNWRTTLCGILAAIAAIITFVAIPILDGNPATSINIGAAIAGVAAALGLTLARDGEPKP
jgi:riboflavin transporter FmnP